MIIARSCSHNLMRARPRGADHRELSLDHAWIVLDTLDQMLLDLPDAALERATVADGKLTSPLAAMKSVSLVPPNSPGRYRHWRPRSHWRTDLDRWEAGCSRVETSHPVRDLVNRASRVVCGGKRAAASRESPRLNG